MKKKQSAKHNRNVLLRRKSTAMQLTGFSGAAITNSQTQTMTKKSSVSSQRQRPSTQGSITVQATSMGQTRNMKRFPQRPQTALKGFGAKPTSSRLMKGQYSFRSEVESDYTATAKELRTLVNQQIKAKKLRNQSNFSTARIIKSSLGSRRGSMGDVSKKLDLISRRSSIIENVSIFDKPTVK